MRFFGDFSSKILWIIVTALLVGGGLTWAVRSLLKPPAVTSVPAPAPVTSTPAPTETVTTLPDESTVTTQSDSVETTDNNNTADDTVATTDQMPALAQAEDVALSVPQKLEKGGILKLYTNNDGNKYPDPIQYSPEKILKTTGLSLIGIGERGKFQEVSGYFLVKESGDYNFVVDYPETWQYWAKDKAYFRMKINGQTLPTSKGGRLSLEKGYHQVSLFLYANDVDGSSVRVDWGKEGDPLETLVIWREVENAQNGQSTSQKEAEKKEKTKPSAQTQSSKENS